MREQVLVIDIGGTKIACGIADPAGHIRFHQTRPTLAEGGAEGILRGVIELARTVTAASDVRPAAMGVSTGGDVDPVTGAIFYATSTIPGWQGAPVRARLEEELELATYVDNDGNAMALGEALFGAGRGYEHVVGVVVGTGVGGGIVIGHKIYRGAKGVAGRLGHVIVDWQDRRPCTCGGAGCLEAYAASLALVADFKAQVTDEEIRALGFEPDTFAVKEMAALADAGHPVAARVIQCGAYMLGIGIASIVNLLNPEIVIVGGGLAQIGERYFTEVRRAVRERAQAPVKGTPIVPAQLGPLANLMGAAELAWQGMGL